MVETTKRKDEEEEKKNEEEEITENEESDGLIIDETKNDTAQDTANSEDECDSLVIGDGILESPCISHPNSQIGVHEKDNAKSEERQSEIKQSQKKTDKQETTLPPTTLSIEDHRKSARSHDKSIEKSERHHEKEKENESDLQDGTKNTEEDGEISTDSDDDFRVDWDATLYLPDPHLITEEQFNNHFPQELVKESILKISKFRGNPNSISLSYTESKSKKPSKKKQKERKKKEQQQVKRAESNFNMDNQSEVVSNQTFREYTKYQTMCREPRFSDIGLNERKWYRWYIDNLKKANHRTIAPHENRFKELLQRIKKEQNELMQHLYNCFLKNPAEYLYIDASVKEFLKQNIMENVQNLLSSSEKLFSLNQTINMKQMPKTGPIRFHYVECVVPQKNIPPLKVLPLNTPLKKATTRVKHVNKKLSAVKELCRSNGAPIYIHQSSLLAIMESLVSPSREWLIPIVVEKTPDSAAINNVIFCCKPYPRRNFGVREANRLYHEKCISEFVHGDKVETELESGVHMLKCGQHTFLVEGHVDAADSKDSYTLSSKIEFQPSIGFEQFSVVDLCQFWWESRLSNTKNILCHRIDPRNNCIRRLDTYTRDTLCGPGCPYNPSMFYSHLSYLFGILCTLQPGEYLLEHANGNAFFFLFQEKTKGFTTLNTKYKDLITGKNELILETQVSSAWLPIDTNIPPVNSNNVLPWLFQSALDNIELIPLGKRAKSSNNNFKNNRESKKRKKLDIKHKVLEKFNDEPLPPGVDRLSPTVELCPPGLESPTSLDGAVKASKLKQPIVYDDAEFDDF